MSVKSENIAKVSKHIDREILCCVSTEVEFILSMEHQGHHTPYTREDIANRCIDNSLEIEELENELAEVEAETVGVDDNEEDLNEKIDELEEKIYELKSEEEEEQEIFEWWKVSSYLCNRLDEWGEPVIKDYNIWGRTCTGQAISLDAVMHYIAKEDGIVE